MRHITLHTMPMKMNNQSGAALLISVVVLLALTIIALASTNSNQLQSLMVRNSQLRMETFNASYAEIDAQIDAINTRSLTLEEQPAYIQAVIFAEVRVDSEGRSVVPLPKFAPADPAYIEQRVTQELLGDCDDFGSDLTDPSRPVCKAILVTSDARLTDRPNIQSNQRQVYNFTTFGDG